MDVAVLAEELLLSQGLEQLVFPDSRCQSCDVDQILLDDSDANKVLAILLLSLPFLYFFLPLLGSSLLLILLNVGPELGDSSTRLGSVEASQGTERHILFLCHNLPLDCLLIIRSPASRAQAIHVHLDVVEAKLAHLVNGPWLASPVCEARPDGL